MTSSTSQASAPVGPGAGRTEHTYRYGQFYRSLAFAPLVSAALAGAAVFLTVLSGIVEPLERLSASCILVIALLGGYRSAGTLLSTFRLTEDQLRQERPLHANKEVPLSEIRRMFIGGRTMEIYASPGPKPDIEFERKLQGADELIEKLVRRLPEGAEIEHPSGELAGRLGKVTA
jgi:hypothetical protein